MYKRRSPISQQDVMIKMPVASHVQPCDLERVTVHHWAQFSVVKYEVVVMG